jgi:hypothetical protein
VLSERQQSGMEGNLMVPINFRDHAASEMPRWRRVRRTFEEYLQNPHASESHKAGLRKRLEHLEHIVTLQEVERVRVIGLGQSHQTTQDSA